MFNKYLFDDNPFDRSAAEEAGISGQISAHGDFIANMVFKTSVPEIPTFQGAGSLVSGLCLLIHMPLPIIGETVLNTIPMVMRLPLTTSPKGVGEISPNISHRFPMVFGLSGSGTAASTKDFVYQHMVAKTNDGATNFAMAPAIRTFIGSVSDPIDLSGFGDIKKAEPNFRIILAPAFNGLGTFTLRRISTMEENIFELEGGTWLSGTVVIDTDMLAVYHNGIHDVSKVASDSVFFHLQPGSNELTITTESMSATFDVTVIWSNRWL